MSSSITAFSLSVIFLASMLHLSSSWPADSITDFAARSKRSVPVDVENPEDVVRVLVKLAQDIMDSDSVVYEKRGIDLGLSRGFSGSQAAKHLMGLAAANFANGPGRKRGDVMEH